MSALEAEHGASAGGSTNPTSAGSYKMQFKRGTKVEVTSVEPGFTGVWFEAVVLGPGRRRKSVEVRYDQLLNSEDETRFLEETIDISLVRPARSRTAGMVEFKRGDAVEAFVNDGWWVGDVAEKVGESLFAVIFSDCDPKRVHASDLRKRFDWVNGEWVAPARRLENRSSKLVIKTVKASEPARRTPRKRGRPSGSFDQSSIRTSSPLKGKKKMIGYSVSSTKLSMKEFELDVPDSELRLTDMITKDLEKPKGRSHSILKVKKKMKRRSLSNSNLPIDNIEFNVSGCGLPSVEVPEVITTKDSNEESLKNVVLCTEIDAKVTTLEVPEIIRTKDIEPLVDTEIDAKVTTLEVPEVIRTKDNNDEWANNFVLCKYKPLVDTETDAKVHRGNSVVTPLPAGSNVVVNESKSVISNGNSAKLASPDNSIQLENHVSSHSSQELAIIEASAETNVLSLPDPKSDQSNSALGISEVLMPQPVLHYSFVKMTSVWDVVLSLDIFRVMPQNPHFRPLDQIEEDLREGVALGHMINFAKLADSMGTLDLEDPMEVLVKRVDALDELEQHGFDVEGIKLCLNSLILVKKSHEELIQEQAQVEVEAAVKGKEFSKLASEVDVIDVNLKKLEVETLRLLSKRSEAIDARDKCASMESQLRMKNDLLREKSDGLKNEFGNIIARTRLPRGGLP